MEKTIPCDARYYRQRRSLTKILLVMKLTIVLLTTAFLNVYAEGLSQSITFSGRNVPLQKVMSIIEQQTGYVFLYQEGVLNNAKPVSISADNLRLEQFLKEVFKDQPLKYEMGVKSIFISPIEGAEQKGKQKEPAIVSIEDVALPVIKGIVRSSQGEILAGATISVKKNNRSTTTDAEGRFSIEASEGEVLVISYVGFDTREFVINKDRIAQGLNVRLEMMESTLNETVVIGYGTRKKSDLTGSVSSVRSSELTAFPTTNIAQALQGRAAGVHVQQNSGAPGSAMQIRIRGTNSIQGSNDPLWIIDGFPGDQSLLNASDIDRIEILKDASATAIYGSRGANGVILVTTKKGRSGATRAEVNSSIGFQSIRKKLDLMDAKEYAGLYNIFWNNTQGQDYFSQSEIEGFGKGTDWQDVIFRQALVHDHSLNVSGDNEKTQFSIGSSYLDQEGIIENSDYRRIVLRASVNHDISRKISISYNAILGRTDNNPTSDSRTVLLAALTAAPTAGPYRADGSYTLLNELYPFGPDDIINPKAYINEVSNKQAANRAMANLAFTLRPVEGLAVRISGNVTNTDSRSDNYTGLGYPTSSGSAGISTSNVLHVNSDNIITYNKTFNTDHNISATAGFTYERYTSKSLSASGSGFLSDVTETANLGAATVFNTPGSSYSQWTLLSYLGRLNYTYQNKYLATISFRADGSSRYSVGNKWGYFPSGALAWRFSEESFMKNVAFISDAKLRIGYGETGSTAIDPYYTLDMLSSGKAPFNDALYTYFAPGTRLPAGLKWETTAQTDIGLDIGFFQNRLRLTADYYVKNTRDLLNTVQLPRSVGYTTTVRNIGSIRNKGVEIQLDANILNGNFKWDVGTTVSFNRSKVVKLYNEQEIPGTVYSLNVANDYVNLLREGHSVSAFYGYQLEGFDAQGRYTYKDNNKDGSITVDDKTWIGDPNPDFIYGFTSNLSWKNFSLNLFIQGTKGNDIFAFGILNQNYKYYQGYNALSEVLYDHWSPDNTDARYPYIDKTFSTRMADNFVYNGSYLRLKTIRLSYNFPVDRINIKWLNKGQVFVSGQNLITLTSYPWWDPDVNTNGGSNSINQGIDYYSYPVYKGITFGLSLTF